MSLLSRAAVIAAKEQRFWNFGNRVLYDLCRKHPSHKDPAIVGAKFWLIGRSYSAAIERGSPRRRKYKDFYRDCVGPEIAKSNIDRFISPLLTARALTPESLGLALEAYAELAKLLHKIAGQSRRSLASKYLHFHVPRLFFIYDSVASRSMKRLQREVLVLQVSRADFASLAGDPVYARFATQGYRLRELIRTRYRMTLTPRQIDQFLWDKSKERQ